jgi:hypothetical protein
MAASTGSVDIGLGAAYGRVIKFEVKGDDANVDSNNTFAILDADGRSVFTATALDFGTDDSTALKTSQVNFAGSANTVGLGYYLAPDEAEIYSQDGTLVTDNQGSAPGVVARSPVTCSFASGTSGDVYEITLFVEV